MRTPEYSHHPRVLFSSLLAALIFSSCTPALHPTEIPATHSISTPESTSIFESNPTLALDFSQLPDGAPIDTSFWNFELGTKVAGYNQEQEIYTNDPQNIFIKDGQLHIKAIKEAKDGRDYTSTRLVSKENFKYGKLEIVAMLPSGAGTWPAAWLQTAETPFKGGPLANGEIDILEAQGARPGMVFSNVHSENSVASKKNPNQGQEKVTDSANAFHRYGVEWTPDFIAFSVDGKEYHRITKTSSDPKDWPFDHQYHLVVNLAMGGSWAMSLKDQLKLPFPNGIDDSTSDNWVMRIKTITYWPLHRS